MQGNLASRLGYTLTYKQYFFCQRFSSLSIQQKCSVHNQSVYEKLNIPQKPKKPLTIYIKFMKEIRPTLVKENPNLKATELVKIVAQRWNSVDSKVKEKLTEEYKKELEIYNKGIAEYDQRLTPEQKMQIQRAEQLSEDIKEEKRTKKKSKDLGRPKQPRGIFMRYLETRKSEKTKYSNLKDWIKNIAEEWKSVNPEVKAKLEEERKHDYEMWFIQLEAWEKKMIKEGHLDVVRSGSLIPKYKGKRKE